jgi:hypothetical protein
MIIQMVRRMTSKKDYALAGGDIFILGTACNVVPIFVPYTKVVQR